MNITPIDPHSSRSSESSPLPSTPVKSSHWTWGRVGKTIGFATVGAAGLAAIGAGVVSLVIAPIAAIPWIAVGVLALGFSSYKVAQTAKKTDQVANDVLRIGKLRVDPDRTNEIDDPEFDRDTDSPGVDSPRSVDSDEE